MTMTAPRVEQITVEARTMLRVQQSVLRALDLLQQLSAAQCDPLDVAGWDAVLQRKQLLLDELEQCNLGAMTGQMRLLADALLTHGQQQLAGQMLENMQAIRDRLLALSTSEETARQRLTHTLDEHRDLLYAHQQQRVATRAYRGPMVQVAPRFMDSQR